MRDDEMTADEAREFLEAVKANSRQFAYDEAISKTHAALCALYLESETRAAAALDRLAMLEVPEWVEADAC